jgi:hypothetical protein
MNRMTDQPPGDNRPPVYPEGDNLIIRASALGSSCLWELAAAGQGYEPGTLPASLQRAFAEGHALEPIIINRLTGDYQVHFLSHQNEYDWMIEPGLIVRFHPDGEANLGSQFYSLTRINHNLRYIDKVELPPRTVIVEVKALSDVLWQKFVKGGMATVIDEYPWQLSSMMTYASQPGLWVGYNKGNPPDENGNRPPCPDKGKLHFELVTYPPISPNVLIEKAHMIKEAVLGEDIVESQRPCDSPDHWPCRYQHLRPEPTEVSVSGDSVVLRLEGEDVEHVDRMVRQYIFSKGQADEATATANRNRDSILELGLGYDAIQTDKWYVPIYGGTTRYLDTAAMVADGIDVEKYYETKPKSRSLNKRNIKRRIVDDTD